MEIINKNNEIEKKEGVNSKVINWEKFLPKNGLRVLLVEADDSTRQIIGALLRKCNYKVATAPDGLKAWEVLKARAHNIDLVLTEVELPSISGYALLTLIMEHEICKNIPVIMMSKYDSVSLVYKCMMRGAAEFLVKPIRINELKNLWQHVWRRQSQVSRGGHGLMDETVAEEKLEATAENNATSDHSSGSKACARSREDCLEKGSDAQSSCGKLDFEAESSSTAAVEDYSQPKHDLSPVNEPIQECHNIGHSRRNLTDPEGAAQDTAAYNGNRALDREQMLAEASHDKAVMSLMTNNSPREAIDLIGTFDNHSNDNSCSHDRPNRYDSSPYLDLSLTRCSPAAPENNISSENQMLNHSNASAFTLYVNKTIQASGSNQTFDRISNAPEDSFLHYGRKVVSIPVNPTKEAENEFDNVSQKLFPIPHYNRRVQVDRCSNPAGYGSAMASTVQTPSPSPSPSSGNQQINRNFCPSDYSPRISTSQPVFVQDHQKLESLDDQAQFSAIGQCGGSSLCSPEGGNEQTHGLIHQRSLQREAALNKFRLKRKDRCFDKKVRYESRKKLAEQRPRVKGQFVRQVPLDPPPPRLSHSGGISVAI